MDELLSRGSDDDLERTLDDVSLPAAVEGYTKQRVELVQRAVKEWVGALIDLGGRNNLLRFRDLRAGTLDLTAATPSAVAALLQGKTIRTSALFTDAEERERNLRRIRTISNKAKENFEERGLETLSIACGLATWNNEKVAAWEPAAPVLLRQAALHPLGAAQDDFELALVDEMEVNPTLLHFLKVNFECAFDEEKLLDRLDGLIDEPWELQEANRWMEEHARGVPSFSIAPRIVLANFAYAKLPMVRDLEAAFDELVAHDLISAIAGDDEAREAVRSTQPGPESVRGPDATPLSDEYLVLDADSSQNWAINAILAGESLIVRGPPGTGKSQTISNLIGSLIARDRRVLFVAEKRAAIDAVLKRLHSQGMGDLVLDLHGGVGSRRAFAQQIAAGLEASRTAPRVEREVEQRRVEKRRGELNDYVRALHEERVPWRISLYELRVQLLELAPHATDIRLRGEVLARLDRDVVAGLEERISDYARLGGLTLAASADPWARARIVSSDEVARASDFVEQLRRHDFPTASQALGAASGATGLPAATTLEDWDDRIALWEDIADTRATFDVAIYDENLPTLAGALAPAAQGAFSRLRASLASGTYKQARKTLGAHASERRLSDRELLERTQRAAEQRDRWAAAGGDRGPQAPENIEQLRTMYDEVLRQLGELENLTGREAGVLRRQTEADVAGFVAALGRHRGTLATLPDLHAFRTAFNAAGLEGLIDELEQRAVSEEAAIGAFRYVWMQSILDTLALSDRLVEGFDPEQHEKSIDDFRRGDREHIESTAGRIKRAAAENAARTRDLHRDQSEIVLHQAGLKRRHMPVRDFVRNTADVLLALKPCWATSPLVVSQLLPAKTYFDVVIFDEASQVTPADAIPAILRGQQLVVAGDEKQLPPTAFFVSESPEDDDDDELLDGVPRPAVAGTKGFESILDALGSLLRPRMLLWHYRSHDERLIAFSNAHIYDRMLVTFPGVGGDAVLRGVHVGHDPAADTNSPTPEVNAVVDLIIEHARERPDESLGVITMGIKHSTRIEECRLHRLRDDPDLEAELSEFFAEDREERFFVKNLERVQGDERDAIILSIGYGKNPRGDLPYRFGPLLTEGGERRLNVAVTRAKNRMTLVSSFTSRDMDPERSDAAGVQLLRQYLQYIESNGTNLGDRLIEKPILNPFEVDVRDTLTRHGLKLVAQYGSSGYWIDYAVAHPTQTGRYVLALECDGASYHSSESARDRDRLRQEQLERLGWRFHRIWSSEWFYDKDKSVARVLDAYQRAVEHADGDHQPETPTRPRREVTAPATRPTRTGSKPIRRRDSIDEYSPSELVALIRWMESDDLIRTEDELLRDAITELGFKRAGKKIVAALLDAIRQGRPT